MTFVELKTQLKTCVFDEVRADKDAFFEAVIRKSNLEVLNSQLKGAFGPPAWPSEIKLSEEISKIIQGYGGVMAGQTLYFTNMDSSPVFAMLWPWGDKEHITLKVGTAQ